MLIYTTEAYRTGLHHRDNRYRFNEERGYWEFNDGIGPWAPSGWLGKKTHAEGVADLTSLNFTPGCCGKTAAQLPCGQPCVRCTYTTTHF